MLPSLVVQYFNIIYYASITDGARVIRNRLLAIFGVAVTVILDWYHLCKKLRQFMSMIAVNKSEKTMHLKFLIPQLWLGLVDNVLEYLRTQVTVRNHEKWLELVGYLEKHYSEIINYNRRRLAGKTIGSGRMEKGVDLTVGRRQKKKAMSWRPLGSKALSLLRVVERERAVAATLVSYPGSLINGKFTDG